MNRDDFSGIGAGTFSHAENNIEESSDKTICAIHHIPYQLKGYFLSLLRDVSIPWWVCSECAKERKQEQKHDRG